MVEAVVDRLPELPVVAMGSNESAGTVLAAMRAGVRDFFVLKRDDTKLAAQVGKLLRRLGAANVVAAASGGQGRIYSVMGAQPHESVAFLAVHLAQAFAESGKRKERVLLVDAAMPAGASAIFLNVSPSYSLLDAVNDVHRCDATLVDTAFSKHNSGLYLLSLPEEGLGRPTISEDDFGRLLQVFKSLFSVVIVALDGQAGTPLLRAAIAQSTRTLLLTDQSILKSRQSKYLLRALRLDDTPLDNAALVVDNYRRRLGLEPQNLAELFDLPLLATLTSDGVSRIQAMNSGESMFAIAPKDPYCEGVTRLAQALATGETIAVEAKSDGLLNRFSGDAMSAVASVADPLQRFRLSDQYQTLKANLHRFLIQQIEERNLDISNWDDDKLDRFVKEQVKRYVVDNRLPVNQKESDALAADARHELTGFGPIQHLVDDPTVNDIVVNGPNAVFVERKGLLQSAPVRFTDDGHVIRVIQRILAPIGRRVDESTPMVDARLPDGSRVNAIIPPIALNGPCLSIRKFRASPLTADDLLRYDSISQAEIDYLKSRVVGRTNLIVVGGTGSGKTTFLNLISQWIPDGERVITVEDAAELRLENSHVVRLETRPPNLEGQRAVTARDLVRNALRMRPDRIIVGEVRGDEVLDMLQAMNTGHDGSMTTLHANSTKDAISRMELLAGFAGFNGSELTFRGQIASSIHLFVHVARLANGARKLMAITEIQGLNGTDLKLRDLFRYDVATGQRHDLREAQ